jgi:hypothetical protein
MFCFPFMPGNCFSPPYSRRGQLEGKLMFLKMMRDSLESRLAAVNAAIATTERQISEDETT